MGLIRDEGYVLILRGCVSDRQSSLRTTPWSVLPIRWAAGRLSLLELVTVVTIFSVQQVSVIMQVGVWQSTHRVIQGRLQTMGIEPRTFQLGVEHHSHYTIQSNSQVKPTTPQTMNTSLLHFSSQKHKNPCRN
jgi:hypothetical protein